MIDLLVRYILQFLLCWYFTFNIQVTHNFTSQGAIASIEWHSVKLKLLILRLCRFVWISCGIWRLSTSILFIAFYSSKRIVKATFDYKIVGSTCLLFWVWIWLKYNDLFSYFGVKFISGSLIQIGINLRLVGKINVFNHHEQWVVHETLW